MQTIETYLNKFAHSVIFAQKLRYFQRETNTIIIQLLCLISVSTNKESRRLYIHITSENSLESADRSEQ